MEIQEQVQETKSPFILAIKASIPVFFCYFPLGVVYGLLFTEKGQAWYFAPLFSFFVLAGAMQFLALSVVGTESSLFTLAISLIPLGIRNIFYGLSMSERFRKAPLLLKYYLAHGLVDATYSVLMMSPPLEEKKDLRFMTILTASVHFYWVLGTLVGAAFGDLFHLPKGLEFSLTAFFAATLVEQFLKTRDFYPLYIGAITLVIAIFLFPNHLFLGAIGLAIGACILLPRRKGLL